MKAPLGWAAVAAILSSATTYTGCHLAERMRPTRDGSLAGSVLRHVSRAVESYRVEHGAYPESLEGIAVEQANDDFSNALLRHVIYRRTDKGFVAFVGLRSVGYIDAEGAPHFDYVR